MTYDTGYVIAKDGTKIGYRTAGSGPAVILVHGGMMASQNFTELGKHLSQHFTVYIPDRRGRGMSSDGVSGYGLVREGEDMQALALHIGAEHIFGLSSGAVIAMQAALTEPSLTHLAVYEPPLPFNDGPTAWIPAYEHALAKGDHGAAMAAVLKGTGDKGFFSLVPRFLLSALFRMAIKGEQPAKENTVPLKKLIEAMQYDIQIVRDATLLLTKYTDIQARLLLMSGSRSAEFLQANVRHLEKDFPLAKHITFKGIGHIAADNSGRPQDVAGALYEFFSA